MIYSGGRIHISKQQIIATELFEITFSRDKSGEDYRKFNTFEQKKTLEAVYLTEETILRIFSFNKAFATSLIYRVPIIFEKISQSTFEKKHKNHYGLIDYPPIGTQWNKTVKYDGIEIKTHTAIIFICPVEKDFKSKEIFETIAHEVIHAFENSFLDPNGVNIPNRIFFLEGITEWLARLVSLQHDQKLVQETAEVKTPENKES